MALSLRSGLCIGTAPYERGLLDKKELVFTSSDVLVCKKKFKGRQVVLREQRWSPKAHLPIIHAQSTSVCAPRAMRWWEKSSKPNMVEIKSAQHLVDSLLDAGDNLVIVDFYSPGCGGCKVLHPKVCQFAESYPKATFLNVNYDEHRSMCQSLHIHVLPFFRFYRGAQGRVSSFSCTNATIKKFKDALAKHGAERCCSIGPVKGLEESELMSLASNREINFSYPMRSTMPADLSLAGRIASSVYAEVERSNEILVMATVQ